MGTSLAFHIVFAVLGVGLPLLMAIAEGLGLWRRDPTWTQLARRWSRAFGVLFAIGAVSGTVLSFELGLLWPRFMAFSGSMVGLPFSAEGFAFFLEAVFLGLCLYGWDRLSPMAHWLTSLPIVVSGGASALFVVMVNAWMNTPNGFRLSGGQLTQVDPMAAAFNPSTATEDPHMLFSAYAVSGFLVAAVYAAGMLRGRVDVALPRGLSILATFDPDAEVRGLEAVPPAERPDPVLVHLSFDTMVGLSGLVGLLSLLFWFLRWRRRDVPQGRLLLWCLVAAGPAMVVAME